MLAPAAADDESVAFQGIESIRPSDTTPDERFDGLIRVARRHFGVAAALIALVDRDQACFASCDESSFKATLRDLSAYGPMFLGDNVIVVPDTQTDERLRDHPLVADNPRFRFYAGHPLTASDGRTIGMFCLLDAQPRELGGNQLAYLEDLARVAAAIARREPVALPREDHQAARRHSESQMALAIAGSGTGIWDRNVVTGEIHYSTAWKAMLGYADSEVSNRIEDSYKRVHPDDLAYVQATIQAHFDQKTESYEVEHRIRCKDGRYKWICSRGKVVQRDGDGKPLRMIGTTTDITAVRTMAERLQQTVDLVTSLTNEVPGLVFQYRRLPTGASFFSYASAGIADIYELAPEQVALSADVIDRLVYPDDLVAYHASLAASAAALSPWHLEYRVRLPRQGLRWRQGDARPQRLADGGTVWHGVITDITERKRIEAELQEFATLDSLTQLPNRRHFMAQIELELTRMRRSIRSSSAILMCDLDYFKSINDEWGHAAGDRVLRHFAIIVQHHLRECDIAGRIGGEEFAILLSGADLVQATVFARSLQRRVSEQPVMEGDCRVALTVSIGISAMHATEASAEPALSRSDQALYRAKKGGRNRIECYETGAL
jgi:diguanylate cyclase (GGDEF)-like protein/PAS domain S-box-containing protein